MLDIRALVPVLMCGLVPASASTADLSKYRGFQLGADLASIVKQAGVTAGQVKDVHRRPALIQELQWHPQGFGHSPGAESIDDVLFTFYEDQLIGIAVSYDRSQTEGMTTEDLVQAVAAAYGPPERVSVPAKTGPGHYGEQEDIVARWQDKDYRFELLRSSYGPSFKLIGVLKRLEDPARSAVVEAIRLDDVEAPAREAARAAGAEQEARTRLDKARLANKPKFRP